MEEDFLSMGYNDEIYYDVVDLLSKTDLDTIIYGLGLGYLEARYEQTVYIIIRKRDPPEPETYETINKYEKQLREKYEEWRQKQKHVSVPSTGLFMSVTKFVFKTPRIEE